MIQNVAETKAYKRVLLKLSGEALMGDDSFGINRLTITSMVNEVKKVVDFSKKPNAGPHTHMQRN